MSNIITWKNATEIIEILKTQNALVSGMSVEEAASALGYVKSAGGVYIKSIVESAATSVAGTTAAGVSEAAATTATTTATNLALYETSTGSAAVAGVGSVALPIAACVAASAGGFLIGAEIYKHNSNFIDKLTFPLYDFITGNDVTSTLYDDDNAPTVPIMFDVNGDTFMPSGMVSGVSAYLNSIGQGVTELDSKRIAEAETFLANHPLYKYYVLGHFIRDSDTFYNHYLAVFSETPFHVIQPYPKELPALLEVVKIDMTNPNHMTLCDCNGAAPIDTLSFEGSGGVLHIDSTTFSTFHTLMVSTNQVLMFGDEIWYTPPASMPSSVTKYVPGAMPSPLKIPNAPSWTPVTLPPNVDPKTMPEPVKTPDGDTNPVKKITPFINPVQPQPKDVPIKKPVKTPKTPTVPKMDVEPDKSTKPQPSPDPVKDPSTDPIEPLPKPQNIPDPKDNGGSPTTQFPIPSYVPSNSTLFHVYCPTSNILNNFGAWLWTTFSGNLIDTLAKLFNNPMDAIIGLHEIYAPVSTGATTTIKTGFLDSGISCPLLSSRYWQIKCGSLSIPEYWGNYLDYAPYTKVHCYLPFIGIVELNADDVIGHGVEITYRIDYYNGSCIALVTTAKKGSAEILTYQYSGNCAVEMPLTSGMKSAVQGALIGAATLAVGAATGGTGLVAAAAVGAVRGASTKNSVQHSGSFGSSYGAMGAKIPYIMVTRPTQKVAYGYNENYGYPAHKKVHLRTCTGYLRAIEVDVVSATATEEEKKMIEELLKSGVYVS